MDPESLREAFRKGVDDIRQLENQRMTFFNIYTVAVGGLMVISLEFFGYRSTSFSFVLFLLSLLSLIGAVGAWRIRASIHTHEQVLKKIATPLGIQQYLSFGAETGMTKWLKMRNIFLWIYVSATVIFAVFGYLALVL